MPTPAPKSTASLLALITCGGLVISSLTGGSAETRANSRQPMEFWRTFFSRPTSFVSPARNPTTDAKIALGKKLFYDPLLSGDGRRSCATCHKPEFGYSDAGENTRRKGGDRTPRDTPTLWNIGWATRLFWNGRAATLEAQAYQPIGAAHEMAGRWPEIIARLSKKTGIRASFAKAFPQTPQPTQQTIVAALAAFQRSLLSPATRFDDWIGGNADALTVSERNGFFLFIGKAGCVGCHAGWRFTDDVMYDIGLPKTTSGEPQRFKTPTLRMLIASAPHMHDGRFATLDEVVAHYADGLAQRPGVAEKLPRDLKLNPRERADLVAFLKTLSTPQ